MLKKLLLTVLFLMVCGPVSAQAAALLYQKEN